MSDDFTEEPPISGPEQPPIVERRSYVGWISLGIVFVAMISLGMMSYLGRAASPNQSIHQFDEDLKQIIFMREVSAAFGRKDSSDWKSKLKDLAKDIEEESKDDPGLVSILVVVNSEIGIFPTNDQLEILSNRKSERSKRIALLYGTKPLTDEDEILWTNKMFVGEMFLDTLVKRHAYQRLGDAKNAPRLFDPWKLRFFPILMAVFGVALCTGPILWLTYFAFRNSGKWKPVGHPIPLQNANGGDSFAGRTALLLASLFMSQLVAELLIRAFSLPDHLSSVLAFALAIGIAVTVMKLPLNGRVSSLKLVGFRSSQPVQDILWGISGAIAAAPIYLLLMGFVLLLQKVLPEAEHPIQAEFTNSTGTFGLMMLVLAASVGAPIFEELVFRGNLLPALQSLFRKPVWAVLLCGLLFAMVHPTGIPVWPILASMGMVAALLTLQRGSLLPAIVMHAVHNGAILLLGLVQI